MTKEYALYIGDEIEAIGTLVQIAQKLNLKQCSVRYYGTETYRKRCVVRKTPYDQTRFLVDLEEEVEGE